MALTLGNWIFIGIVLLVGIFAAFLVYHTSYNDSLFPVTVTMAITVVIIIISIIAISWYNTSTASGIRSYKDFKSELSNGIDREITITAEDGREIFYYEGKVDVESNHEDNYIKFEGEDGRRYMIYYGIQDTIKIIEKEEK